MEVYIGLSLSALLPVVLSGIIYVLKHKTKFGEISETKKQIIIGIVFGLAAVVGTEFGVDIGGAVANTRDAAVLCAGLIFGGPAGIIAGTIGGLERYIAVYWGVGSFTRIACSVSTFLAGIYAAFLRKKMFEDRRPSFAFGLATGIVMEVIHMILVFLTNLNQAEKAYEIVKICTLPMLLCNGISVMLACVLVQFFSKKFGGYDLDLSNTIARITQKTLLICVVASYFITTGFVFLLQTGTAEEETSTLLSINIQDVITDIGEASDKNLLNVTENVANTYDDDNNVDLNKLLDLYGISEINIINHQGIITKTTQTEFVGFNMNTGQQAKEFLPILDGHIDYYVQKYGPISFSEEGEPIFRKYAAYKIDDGGMVQVGLDTESLQKLIRNTVKNISHNRHIGENGTVLISDHNGLIISSDYNLNDVLITNLGIDLRNKNTLERYQANIFGEKHFIMYNTAEGYDIIAIYPERESYSTRDKAVYVNSYMQVLVFALIFFIIYRLIKRVMVNNMKEINNNLSQIIAGDLNVTVDVRGTTEFSNLSDDLNHTVGKLKELITEAEQRIDTELQFAKNIQMSSLPSIFPSSPRFNINASMRTAKEVGGDFYDCYMLGGNKLGFLIADVSGKGIPAAMFMMKAKTVIKAFAEEGLPVNEIFTRSNIKLCEGNDQGMFVTAWMGILDTFTGHVAFVNAGHNPPLIYRNGKYEYLKSKAGFVLAGFDGFKYQMQEFDLEPNDKLYLYTDGVTEATNLDKELYGEDRLENLLNTNSKKHPNEMLEIVFNDIDEFDGKAEQFDDITMLMVEFNGGERISREFDAVVEELDNVNGFIEEELDKHDVNMKTKMLILVTAEEIFVNIAHYAYKGSKGKATVEVGVDNDVLTLRFIDSGVPFNPLKKEDPDVTLSAEERNIGGLGIYMVKNTMDEVSYEYLDNKNMLTIKKGLK